MGQLETREKKKSEVIWFGGVASVWVAGGEKEGPGLGSLGESWGGCFRYNQ